MPYSIWNSQTSLKWNLKIMRFLYHGCEYHLNLLNRLVNAVHSELGRSGGVTITQCLRLPFRYVLEEKEVRGWQCRKSPPQNGLPGLWARVRFLGVSLSLSSCWGPIGTLGKCILRAVECAAERERKLSQGLWSKLGAYLRRRKTVTHHSKCSFTDIFF